MAEIDTALAANRDAVDQLIRTCSSKRCNLAPSAYCPTSNTTFDGEVLPELDNVIGYSPPAICGTVKFTWNCPGATSAAAKTGASTPPIVTVTPVMGIGEVTGPEVVGPNPAA